MFSVTVDASQVVAWEKDLRAKAIAYPVQATQAVVSSANTILNNTRLNIASAPPPKRARPRRRRGPDFADTFRVEVQMVGDWIGADVGTDAPYGWRFEIGFVGADSLGRHYNQIPRPVLGPAADAEEPALQIALANLASSIP